MSARLLIGITGGSGSGKTHFLKKLMETLPEEDMSLFSMDNYYFPIHLQEKDENGVENFDRPESIDRARFFEDLKKLKSGQSLTIREYNFNYLSKERQQIHIPAAPIIIVEGLFTFYFDEIADLIDLKLYIDTPDYLMLKRRILRDAEERGYDLSDVLYRYEHHVTPAFHQYIAPYRHTADLVIPNHKNFDTAVDVITAYIRRKTG